MREGGVCLVLISELVAIGCWPGAEGVFPLFSLWKYQIFSLCFPSCLFVVDVTRRFFLLVFTKERRWGVFILFFGWDGGDGAEASDDRLNDERVSKREC